MNDDIGKYCTRRDDIRKIFDFYLCCLDIGNCCLYFGRNFCADLYAHNFMKSMQESQLIKTTSTICDIFITNIVVKTNIML